MDDIKKYIKNGGKINKVGLCDFKDFEKNYYLHMKSSKKGKFVKNEIHKKTAIKRIIESLDNMDI